MKAVLCLLLGVTSAFKGKGHFGHKHEHGALNMEEAWKKTVIDDWHSVDHSASFVHWKKEFGKTYTDLEAEGKAFITFLENWHMINEFNKGGEESYTLGMNQFSDMKEDEFKLYVHGHEGSCLRKSNIAKRSLTNQKKASNADVPDAVDWTNVNGKSYVSAVKNQGQCGSCWAFSTTGAIESRSAIAQGKTDADIVTLSEQQLVDCSKAEGNLGCNGGLMDDGFKYVEESKGLCSEADYPYTAKTGRVCLASQCQTMYDPITNYTDVTADSEQDLMAAVAEGPVSIAIEADQRAFQFYSGGVLTGTCGDRLDHGVLVVGYGESDSQKYWKVKNSWGATWGEEGYILLCRDCDANEGEGECGILMSASYPVVAVSSA
mmetsp:Transcript_26363/g.41803  ORF Transcript_26363/g.41803 Transcript_26363/m.41803 type:complete len:376 (-) Transcript_26363:140-1267(-)|eukprot:CAMPEP_0197036476 /NCGR_PEP_ID=MMETSP1384-20130603/13969_1 /TAXON_ID=29189 /ORGANISM="Ammonia sp." /LENGTH=375 /DNA_ID=CAMNT_0042466657 /DNA_START=88 /DNA_END=1215 /DNA_ORIENTATION=+